MHIFRHILTRIPKNHNFFHKTLKNQKKILMNGNHANNEQGSMKRGDLSGFQKNFEKNLT